MLLWSAIRPEMQFFSLNTWKEVTAGLIIARDAVAMVPQVEKVADPVRPDPLLIVPSDPQPQPQPQPNPGPVPPKPLVISALLIPHGDPQGGDNVDKKLVNAAIVILGIARQSVITKEHASNLHQSLQEAKAVIEKAGLNQAWLNAIFGSAERTLGVSGVDKDNGKLEAVILTRKLAVKIAEGTGLPLLEPLKEKEGAKPLFANLQDLAAMIAVADAKIPPALAKAHVPAPVAAAAAAAAFVSPQIGGHAGP